MLQTVLAQILREVQMSRADVADIIVGDEVAADCAGAERMVLLRCRALSQLMLLCCGFDAQARCRALLMSKHAQLRSLRTDAALVLMELKCCCFQSIGAAEALLNAAAGAQTLLLKGY